MFNDIFKGYSGMYLPPKTIKCQFYNIKNEHVIILSFKWTNELQLTYKWVYFAYNMYYIFILLPILQLLWIHFYYKYE